MVTGTANENSTRDATRLAVQAEQVRLLFEALPVSVAASFINAGILVYVLWGVISPGVLIGWLVFVSIVFSGRLVLFLFYRKVDPGPWRIQRWSRMFLVGSSLAAVGWGSSMIIMFAPGQVVYQVFLAFVLSGMCAGAVTTLSFTRLPAMVFILVVLPLMAVRLFMEATVIGNAMAVMALLFLVIMISSILKFDRNTEQNIRYRIEADARESKLRESESRLRTVFESAPLGLVHYNSSAVILACNENAAELFNLPKQQLESVNLLRLVDDPGFRAALHNSLSGEPGLYNGTTAIFGSGKETPVRVFFRGTVSLSGMVTGGVMILEDMTDDQRIRRMKDEFISTVSHELRTPLTAINGAISMLAAGKGSQINETQQRELLDMACRNADRLLLLVNDILDISKISAGKMVYHLDPQLLMPVIERSLEDNRVYAEKHKVHFRLVSVDESVVVNVDKDRMMQVMTNLLSNAAKFSPAGSGIDISVERSGGMARILVRDYGAGIPESYQSSLFEQFTQDDSSDARKVGGTGLGLYISREIVHSMNGRISFETAEGEGTTFIVELPLLEAGA